MEDGISSPVMSGATAPASSTGAALLAQLAALSASQLSNLASLINLMSTTPASFILSIRNSDQTSGNQELSLTTAGTYQLAVDGNGNLTLSTPPPVPRVETLTLDATVLIGTVKTVNLTTPFPDANYEVLVAMRGLAGAVQVVPGSQTAGSFQVKITAVVVGTIAFPLIHDNA